MPFFGVPIRNGLPIGLGSVAGFGVQQFDPLELFAGGAEGVWYDPSDTSTLFQDPAGTTPVTAVEQPVGLMLDKSKGLVLGSELVTNGNFSSGTTGWSTSTGFASTATVVSGEFQVTASVASGRQISAITCVIGQTYVVTGVCRQISGTGSAFIGISNTTNGASIYTATSNNTSTFVATRGQFVATATTMYVVAGSTGGQGVTAFDNISVRELPGNHAISYNGTTARPTLSARVNLLTYSEEFDNGVWNKGTSTVVTPDAGIAPNGTTTAERLQMPIGGGTFLNQQVSVTNGVTYTFSFFANALAASVINIGFAVGFSSSISISDSGPITIAAGWAQYSFQVVSNTTGSLWISIDNNLNTTSCDMLIWGADLRVSNIGSAVPSYQRIAAATDYDTNGFPKYLRFAGVDDGMSTPANLNLTSTDKVTVFSGVRKLSDAVQAITELSLNINTNNGAFEFFCNLPNKFEFGSKGTIGVYPNAAAPAPTTRVMTGIGDISGDSAILRLGGTQVAQSTADQGTGNYGSYPLYIGSRNNASFWFNGYLYGLTVVGAQLTTPQIESMESWTAQRTGVTL